MAEPVAGFAEHLPERHLHLFQLRQPALQFGPRQGGEQVVAARIGRRGSGRWARG
jgi:hypothetical protein